MKTLFFITLLSTSLAMTAHAAEADCLGAVKQALLPGQQTALELKNGTLENGLKCEFAMNYQEATSGLTHQFYRTLKFTHSAQLAYPDGTVSELAPYALDRFSDNTNGLNSYEVTACTISGGNINLQYTVKQRSGWHSSSKKWLQVTSSNGKVTSVNGCNF